MTKTTLNLLDHIHHTSDLVAGVDEVGRGCLCGNVVAAVVVMPFVQIERLEEIGVNDSKKLTAKKRSELAPQIQELALDWQISEIDSQTIDRINILQASLLAMKQAINKLSLTPDLCLIDGNQLIPNLSLPQIALVKGDQRSSLIASASILAKVYRDRQMIAYHLNHPEYDFHHNKGYGSKKHLEAIEKYGLTPQHRLSFSPCKKYLQGKINFVGD